MVSTMMTNDIRRKDNHIQKEMLHTSPGVGSITIRSYVSIQTYDADD